MAETVVEHGHLDLPVAAFHQRNPKSNQMRVQFLVLRHGLWRLGEQVEQSSGGVEIV